MCNNGTKNLFGFALPYEAPCNPSSLYIERETSYLLEIHLNPSENAVREK